MIRRLFIASVFLLLVAEPSAALNIAVVLDVDEHEIWLSPHRDAFELDREAWTLFTTDEAITDLNLDAPDSVPPDDDFEISLNRVSERP